jgi:membrane protein DedA with SNARE-associated domain
VGNAVMGDSNTAMTIVLTVMIVVVGFLAANVILFTQARRQFGEPKPKKKLGAKQKKRQMMKRGLRAAGE